MKYALTTVIAFALSSAAASAYQFYTSAELEDFMADLPGPSYTYTFDDVEAAGPVSSPYLVTGPGGMAWEITAGTEGLYGFPGVSSVSTTSTTPSDLPSREAMFISSAEENGDPMNANITFTTSTGVSEIISTTSTTAFIGFISNVPLEWVEISAGVGGSIPTWIATTSNVTAVIPEPATTAFILGGVAVSACFWWRRRIKSADLPRTRTPLKVAIVERFHPVLLRLLPAVLLTAAVLVLPVRVIGAIVLESRLYTEQDNSAFGFLYLSVSETKVEYSLWTSGDFIPPWEVRFDGLGTGNAFSLGSATRHFWSHTHPSAPEPWTRNPFTPDSTTPEGWLPVDGRDFNDAPRFVQWKVTRWHEFAGTVEDATLAGLLRSADGATAIIDALAIREGPDGVRSIRLNAVGQLAAAPDTQVTSVPEPAAVALVIGVTGLAIAVIRRRRSHDSDASFDL